jgi:hypothetical protein
LLVWEVAVSSSTQVPSPAAIRRTSCVLAPRERSSEPAADYESVCRFELEVAAAHRCAADVELEAPIRFPFEQRVVSDPADDVFRPGEVVVDSVRGKASTRIEARMGLAIWPVAFHRLLEPLERGRPELIEGLADGSESFRAEGVEAACLAPGSSQTYGVSSSAHGVTARNVTRSLARRGYRQPAVAIGVVASRLLRFVCVVFPGRWLRAVDPG